MRAVHFDPSDARHEAFWRKWELAADSATAGVIEAWEDWIASDRLSAFRYDFDHHAEVWREFKRHIASELFFDKCAYCEASDESFDLQGEHFRPKKSPQNASGALADGTPVTHPGYFWLAFHWRNLVPACPKCNGGKGKRSQFPVSAAHLIEVRLSAEEVGALYCPADAIESPKRPGVYYLGPQDLDEREGALGLMPLNCHQKDDPRKHLAFGVRGTIAPRGGSARGSQSIDLYDLRREKLRIARQRQQERIEAKHKCGSDLADWHSGREPYSVAALDCLNLIQSGR